MTGGSRPTGRHSKAFQADDDERTDASPEWRAWLALQVGDDLLADSFKRAGDILVESVKSHREADELFFPIAYLYRHHIELMLKSIVTHPYADGTGRPGKWPSHHDLERLWTQAKQMLPYGYSPEVEDTILAFDAFDPKSDSFRYVRDKDGNPRPPTTPKLVGLEKLKAAVDEVNAVLYGALCGMWPDGRTRRGQRSNLKAARPQ